MNELENILRCGFTWSERNETIVAMRERGITLKNIGDRFGITPERVRQILGKRQRLLDAVKRRQEQMSESKRKEEEKYKRIDAIIKEFADRGLIIEGGWEALKAGSMPRDVSQDQIDDMRFAFFGGAQYLFSCIMTFKEPGEEPTRSDLRRLTLIHKELQNFLKSMKKKPLYN